MINMLNIFPISNQIFFAERLSLLLESGISLTDSIKILKSIENSKQRQLLYSKIVEECDSGISLSKSLLNLKIRFDPLFISLIKNGEQTGNLPNSLKEISRNLEKRNDLRKRLISTMIYPTFIFFATIAMTLFLVLYIFPKILPLLSTMNIELPFLTRLVKTFYELSIHYGLYFSLFLMLIITSIIILYRKYLNFKRIFHFIVLRIPLLKIYIITNIISNISSIGQTFLLSGKSLSDLHLFLKDSISNIIYKDIFIEIYSDSLKGVTFSNSMKNNNQYFSNTLINMTEIGEKTGNLAMMLGHSSKIFEQDMDMFLKRFSALIEPILMIFMGIIVGGIALSIILPVYEITNHLSK